jgi:hypothetical protein
MNVRPDVFCSGDRSPQSAFTFLFWQIDQGRPFRLPGFAPTLPQADRRLIYAIASSLLPWVFPVSGLPDTGMGASVDASIGPRLAGRCRVLIPCYPLVGFRRLVRSGSRLCRTANASLAGPSAYSAAGAWFFQSVLAWKNNLFQVPRRFNLFEVDG